MGIEPLVPLPSKSENKGLCEKARVANDAANPMMNGYRSRAARQRSASHWVEDWTGL